MAGLLKNQAEPMPEQQSMPADSGASLDDPALEQAINYMGKKLYSEDLAEEIAGMFSQSEVAQPKLLAMAAMKIAESSDVETDGDIKEENLSILGMMALNEVVTIAEAAGVQIAGSDVSAAFKEMVIMFAQDQGLSPEEIGGLKEAMARVDDAELAAEAEALPDDYDEMLPDEDVPVGDREMGA
jgi:hypothetical protein